MVNKNKPAFPYYSRVGEIEQSQGGLTKREYFAAKICAAFSSIIIPHGHSLLDLSTSEFHKEIARQSVHRTDALIAELEKKNA